MGIALAMLSVGLLVTPSDPIGCDTTHDIVAVSTLVFADHGIEPGTLQLSHDPASSGHLPATEPISGQHYDAIGTDQQQLLSIYTLPV